MFDASRHPLLAPEAHGSFIVRFGDGGFRSWPEPAAQNDGDAPLGDPGDSIRSLAYADGFAAGHAAAECDGAEQSGQLALLAASLEALQPAPQSLLASLLAEAVAAMIERALPAITLDRTALEQSATAMIACLADEIDGAVLHAHPADAALLAGAGLTVEVSADTGLAPGTLRLATRQGWIEDGPQLRLARFRKAIAGGASA